MKTPEDRAAIVRIIDRLTAGDLEVSGASDDISKPIDKSQLLSLVRVWLSR